MFKFRASKIVLGKGERKICGKILKEINAKKVLVVTGKKTGKTNYFLDVLRSIEEENIDVTVWNEVQTEPDEETINSGVEFTVSKDAIVAFGGGSVIDTAKILNICEGKKFSELKIPKKLKPLIAIPTTFGTGSETTCAAVVKVGGIKKGILHESLLPDFAIVDWGIKAPKNVSASAGMDAIMHAFEAYTCIESDCVQSNFYSGSNEITDSLSLRALDLLKNLPEYVNSGEFARKIAVGSNIAGMAFGNAGVHFGHAAAYAIASLCDAPHGVCVSSIGQALMDWLRKLDSVKDKISIVDKIMNIDEIRKKVGLPSLSELGIGYDDIPELVRISMGIDRLISMRPEIDENAAKEIFEVALSY